MISFVSTRGGAGERSFEDVLLAGLAEDGGLFVPQEWPELDLVALKGLDYPSTVAAVMQPFVEGCFTQGELLALCHEAYAEFQHPAIAPLRQMTSDMWLLELFHGPTLAFKDFALQLLGRMFERVLARRGETLTIVGATSGDTGSAAIRGCASRSHMRICILHPKGRVSDVQRRQMTTQVADNVLNLAVEGSFDDCQDRVKDMFNDEAFRRAHNLGAINSINFARLAAQVAYYVYAGIRLQAPVTFSVPTGNFGDVYAGYVAGRMGLPIGELIVATNRNDILARFFETGEYRIEPAVATMSPSMDIQIASNFERLLFEIHDRDGASVAQVMRDFRTTQSMRVERSRLDAVAGHFRAARVDEAGTLEIIERWHRDMDYVVDPHTAIGLGAGERLHRGANPLVCLATAHPAKFSQAIKDAIGKAVPLPERSADLWEKAERFDVVKNDLKTIQDRIQEQFS